MHNVNNIRIQAAIATALLLGIQIPGAAQALQRNFAASLVILQTGDTLRGPLTYFPKQDLIILTMPDLTQRTYSPTALRAFVVKGEINRKTFQLLAASRPTVSKEAARLGVAAVDPESPFLARVLQQGNNKVFITHQWPAEQIRRYHIKAGLFEVVIPGRIMLLQRQDEVMPAQQSKVYYKRPTTEFLLKSMVQTADAFTQTDPHGGDAPLKSRLYLSMPTGELKLLRNPRKQLLAYFPGHNALLEKFAQDQGILWSTPSGVAQVVAYINTLPPL